MEEILLFLLSEPDLWVDGSGLGCDAGFQALCIRGFSDFARKWLENPMRKLQVGSGGYLSSDLHPCGRQEVFFQGCKFFRSSQIRPTQWKFH